MATPPECTPPRANNASPSSCGDELWCSHAGAFNVECHALLESDALRHPRPNDLALALRRHTEGLEDLCGFAGRTLATLAILGAIIDSASSKGCASAAAQHPHELVPAHCLRRLAQTLAQPRYLGAQLEVQRESGSE